MVWSLLNLVLLVLLGGSVLYVVPFAVAGWFYRPPDPPRPDTWPRLAVLIPSYKEDAVILDTARRAADHAYPGSFEVFIIADSMQPETLAALREMPLTVHEVAFENSTKAKALRTSIDRIPEDAFDAFVILDADNVMADGCLEHMARALTDGFRVVQGRRTAKNVDGGLAQLDGFSEAIGNHIFRRGHRALGLSAALIGSAKAVDASLFRRLIHAATNREVVLIAEDKEIEMMLTYEGVEMEYAERAVVYDEKVSDPTAFVPQRTRWIAAQTYYMQRHALRGLRSLLRLERLDYVDKVAQMIIVPRSLLLLLLPVAALINGLVGATAWAAIWAGHWALLVGALWLSLPTDRPDLSVWRALRSLPQGIVLMARAALDSPSGRSTFLNTPHGSSDASDPPSPS
jgi:cellulose synthase/poly-beta-1,6-N-acetylglucosamine synthase-like glycosyltransferase